jgi:ABC-type lipoprotein release transport system permease subunit
MKGPGLAVMAWRNLWRNRRRTIVTALSIAFGIMLAVLFTGLGDLNYTNMINLAARLGTGHVTIQHPGYQDAPSLKRTVTGVSALQKTVLGERNVLRAVPRITGQTMLATAGQSYGAYFMAIDPAAEDRSTLSLLEAIKEGKMFESAGSRGIVVGRRLADNLNLKLGRKVVYTMTDKEGEIVSGLARVTGILETGAPSIDGTFCMLPIGTLREALGYGPDEATHVAIFISDQRKSYEVAARVRAAVGGRVAVLTWHDTQPEISGFVSMKVGGMRFLELVILFLVAAGILNTLLVSVLERMREFGIMMALGFSPGRLFGLVMWESLWLGLVGVVTSVLLTAGPYYTMNTRGLDFSAMLGSTGGNVAGVVLDPILRCAIYPENAAAIVIIVLLATLLSGVYPAWKAGRVVPVESIKLV